MAASLSRALQLLELLQSAQTRNVAELAATLGVDERTVRRDVAQLVELGMPVESLRGRYGGYRLAAGRSILPIVFSGEELMAVFLGLVDAQASAREPSVAAQTALSKIRRALPASDARRIDAALAAMTPAAEGHGATPDPGVMLTIAESVGLRRAVELRYRSGEGTPSRRVVHPYGLVAHAQRWYLIAFDTKSGAERTFRVDRISAARSAPGAFAPPEREDLASHLLERFAEADYRWHVVLRIHDTADRIRAHLPPSVAKVERIEDTPVAPGDALPPWHRVEIHAQRLDWLPGVIAALGCEVVIDSPEELRDDVREAAARMLDAAR